MADATKAESKKRRLANQWPQLQKKMKKWIELAEPNPPSAILIAVQDNQIVWEGPSFMKAFVSDDRVRQSFLQTALQRPVNLAGQTGTTTDADSGSVQHIVLPYRDVGMYGINALQKLIPSILNPSGERNFWAPQNRPDWWPKEVRFVSPNHPGDHGPKVSAEELRCVLEAAIAALPRIFEFTVSHDTPRTSGEASQPPTPPEAETSGASSPHHSHPTHDVYQTFLDSKDYHGLMRQLLPKTRPDLKRVAQHLLPCLKNELPTGVVEELRSRDIDDEYTSMCPDDNLVCRESSRDGHCLYSSLSLLIGGSKRHKMLLRLGAGLFGLHHASHYSELLQQMGFRTLTSVQSLVYQVCTTSTVDLLKPEEAVSPSDLLKALVEVEARDTLNTRHYSGWLQVLFLAGFTNSIINQHVTRDETNRADMDMYASTLQPCICSKVQDREVSIMWVNSGAHIVPLFHKECVVP